MLEALPRVVPLEDEEISKEAARAFRKRGIDAFAGAKVQDVKRRRRPRRGHLRRGRGRERPDGERGGVPGGHRTRTEQRRPGYEEAGVGPGPRLCEGGLDAADQLPRVGGGRRGRHAAQLAHSSFLEGIAVAERIAGLEVPEIDYAGIPRVTFSQPEIASVGLHRGPGQVKRGHEVATTKFQFAVLAKSNIVGEGGIVKAVVEKEAARSSASTSSAPT